MLKMDIFFLIVGIANVLIANLCNFKVHIYEERNRFDIKGPHFLEAT